MSKFFFIFYHFRQHGEDEEQCTRWQFGRDWKARGSTTPSHKKDRYISSDVHGLFKRTQFASSSVGNIRSSKSTFDLPEKMRSPWETIFNDFCLNECSGCDLSYAESQEHSCYVSIHLPLTVWGVVSEVRQPGANAPIFSVTECDGHMGKKLWSKGSTSGSKSGRLFVEMLLMEKRTDLNGASFCAGAPWRSRCAEECAP